MNMSFALTTEQIRARTKTVTRRIGWRSLKVGQVLQPIVKGQGLKKGEKVEKVGGPIRVVKVNRERLCHIGPVDLRREGFHFMSCTDFIAMFCKANKCTPDTEVTRIEFEYV